MGRYFLLFILVGLIGCTRPAAKQVHLRYALWGSVEQVESEKKVIAAFEAENPEIKLDLVVISSLRYPSKIQSMIVGSVAPDLFWVGLNQYQEWALRGVLKDVTEEAMELQRESEWMPLPKQTYRVGSRYFALPINCHGWVTYYNQEAFKAAGVTMPPEGPTWEWITEVGPKLSRKAGATSATTDYALVLPYDRAMLLEYGGSLVDDLFYPRKITANQPITVDFFKRYRKLMNAPYGVTVLSQQDQGNYQLFRDGKAAMFFSGRWSVPMIRSAGFAWDVVPYPAGPVKRLSDHGGTGLGINRTTAYPKEAVRFLKFYAGQKGSRIGYLGGRNTPIYRELAHSPEFLAQQPPAHVRRFSETMEAGASSEVLYAPGVLEFGRIYEQILERVRSDSSVSEEQLAKELQEDLERWLERMKKRGVF